MSETFSLKGRVALVSGAGGHLGTEMVLALARAGAEVLLNGRDASKLEPVRESLVSEGLSASVLPFDVTVDEERTRAIAEIDRRFGRLDVLVNNAYAGRPATFDASTIGDFEQAYEIAVTAAFRLVQLARPLLRAAKSASVINVSSMYGIISPDPRIYGPTGYDNPPFYGAAKAALVQLTRYLACHLATDGIRANCITAGPFPPPSLAQTAPEFHRALCEKVPLGRVGRANEIAGPVLFLASDASSFVTGADLRVDGGWTAW